MSRKLYSNRPLCQQHAEIHFIMSKYGQLLTVGQVSKLLPLLAQGDGVNKPAFEIVAPSLPNFGFSEGAKQRGMRSFTAYRQTKY